MEDAELMTLLTEIQQAATDSATSVGTILRKCLVLATRLRHGDLKSWVERELNGYPSAGQVEYPPYRIVQVQSFGNFSGPFGSGLQNAPIALTCIPESTRSRYSRVHLREPVSTYESLLAVSGGNNLRMPWSPEVLAVVGGGIYEDMNCLQAWQLIPSNALVTLLENVRNRILSLTLQIEADYPGAGEVKGSAVPPESAVNHVFQTYIMGNVQNWATASSSFSQVSISSTVQQANFESLRARLVELEVPSAEISDLEKAVKAEPTIAGRAFGPRVSKWLGSMLSKAAQGAWKVTTEAGAKVLTEALLGYYGLK